VLTSDVDVEQTAQAAELFLSDGVIVTGTATGSAANASAVKSQSNAIVVSITLVDFIHTVA